MANVKITQLTAATVPLSGTELLELVQGGSSTKVAASAIANTATTVRTVATGGTGAATLTGYVKGNGTSAMTASATIPIADITGVATVPQGGTGVGTLTAGQYLKGNGTSAITSSATIPYNDMSGRAYISAFSAIDQTGNIAAATAAIIGTTSFSSGISMTNNGSGNATRITFTEAGTYMLAPSIQFKNVDTSDHDATIWFRKNGTDIANSATITNIPKAADGGAQFFQIVIYEQVTAGQYIEIMWLPEDADVTIDYTAAGAIAPAIPSIILVSERIA